MTARPAPSYGAGLDTNIKAPEVEEPRPGPLGALRIEIGGVDEPLVAVAG